MIVRTLSSMLTGRSRRRGAGVGVWCGVALAGALSLAQVPTWAGTQPPRDGQVVGASALLAQEPGNQPPPTPNPDEPAPQPGEVPPDAGAQPPEPGLDPTAPPDDSQPAPANGDRAQPEVVEPTRPPLMQPADVHGLPHFSGIDNQRPISGQAAELFDVIRDPQSEISMVVGRSKVLMLREIPDRVAIGDDTVATFTFPSVAATGGRGARGNIPGEPSSPKEQKLFTLIGLRFGTTDLTIWDKNNVPYTFLIRVTLDTQDLEQRIKTIFPGADIEIKQTANQIVLDGQVPDAKTMTEVLNVIQGSLQVGSAVGGAGGLGAAAPGGGGFTPSAALRPQIINRVKVPGPRQILLKVKLAELNRTAIREIGVNWLRTSNDTILGSQPGNFGGFGANSSTTLDSAFNPRSFGLPSSVGGQVIPGFVADGTMNGINSAFNATAGATLSGASQLFGIFNAGQFDLFINALRNNQLATILAEPNLVALDGQPARFLAGGEFPFPVPQLGAGGGGNAVITIQFRPFGAILTFIPTIMEDDLIRLDVEPTFSQLNFGAGTSVNGTSVPGLNERSARTIVQMREGQTLALAGLISKTTNASTVRVPLLGDIPIAGQLFSRNRIETVETELVVCVTPYFVNPMEADQVPPGPGETILEPNDLEFYFLGRLEGKTGHPHRATTQHHDPFHMMKHFKSEDYWVVGPHGHAN